MRLNGKYFLHNQLTTVFECDEQGFPMYSNVSFVESQRKVVREFKRLLLSMSDYTQLPDTNPDSETWATWRAYLRDTDFQLEDETWFVCDDPPNDSLGMELLYNTFDGSFTGEVTIDHIDEQYQVISELAKQYDRDHGITQ